MLPNSIGNQDVWQYSFCTNPVFGGSCKAHQAYALPTFQPMSGNGWRWFVSMASFVIPQPQFSVPYALRTPFPPLWLPVRTFHLPAFRLHLERGKTSIIISVIQVKCPLPMIYFFIGSRKVSINAIFFKVTIWLFGIPKSFDHSPSDADHSIANETGSISFRRFHRANFSKWEMYFLLLSGCFNFTRFKIGNDATDIFQFFIASFNLCFPCLLLPVLQVWNRRLIGGREVMFQVKTVDCVLGILRKSTSIKGKSKQPFLLSPWWIIRRGKSESVCTFRQHAVFKYPNLCRCHSSKLYRL